MDWPDFIVERLLNNRDVAGVEKLDDAAREALGEKRSRLIYKSGLFELSARSILTDVNAAHWMIEDIVAYLQKQYDSTPRLYHNYTHILQMLTLAQHLECRLEPHEALAVLYHDAVMSPAVSDNEQRSANLVRQMTYIGVSEEIVNPAVDAIVATSRHHVYDPDVPTYATVVLDLDLANMADPDYERFHDTCLLVEAEIGMNSPEIRKKRLEWLEKFLSRGRLFYKFDHLEEQARSNMERYRDGLIERDKEWIQLAVNLLR